MDWDAIKRAQEAQKMLDSPGVREALKHREMLERSGLSPTRLSEHAAMTEQAMRNHPSYSVNVKAMIDLVEALRRPLPPEWLQAKSNVSDLLLGFGRSILDIKAAANSAAEPLRNFIVKWQEANQRLNDVVRTAPSDSLLGLLTRQATGVYDANTQILIREIEERNLLRSNRSLAARLMIPTVSFLDFSQRTVERIGSSANPDERASLGGSLLVAEEQVTDSTSLILEATEETYSDTVPTTTAGARTYGIYDAVQLDLIDVVNLPAEATYPVLLRFSSAASLADLTRRTLRAVLRCNKTSKLKSRAEVFKPTSQAQEGLVMLSGIVVRDDSSLRDLISYLYMLIYEGAGNQKLRFLKENGGPTEPTECDVIWNLKALRNKWLSHDPEHGDEKTVARSYRSLADALKSLGLNSYPRYVREFEDLQRRLLSGLQSFLEDVDNRISNA